MSEIGQLGWEGVMLEEWVSSRIGDLSDFARIGYAQHSRGAVVTDGAEYNIYMPPDDLRRELAEWPALLAEVLERVSTYPPRTQGVALVSSAVAGGVSGDSWVFEFPLITSS